MRPATILTIVAGGFLGGVFLSSFIFETSFVMGSFFIGAFVSFGVASCRFRAHAMVVGVLLIAMGLGVWRFGVVFESFQAEAERISFESVQVVNGRVIDIDRRENKTFAVLRGSDSDIRLTFPFSSQIQEGQNLSVRGRIERPPVFDDFDYAAFLRAKGISAIMIQPVIVDVQESSGMVDKARQALRKGLERTLPFPVAGLAQAMVLGEKGLIDSEDNEILIASGARHIVAISGLHMSLIFSMLLGLFIAAGLWRRWAALVSFGVLGLYVVLVGAPASAVRALLFVITLEGARIMGRPGKGLRVLLLIAASMVAWNPFLIRWDVGFQLSFLAVLGIGLFSDYFENLMRALPWSSVRSLMAMSLAAMITTVPIVAFTFGRISLVAPLANMIALPLLPFLVGGGFLAAFIGWAAPSIASLVGVPVWGLYELLRRLLLITTLIPYSSLTVSIMWPFVLMWETVLVWWSWKRHKQRVMPRWDYDNYLNNV